MCYFITYSFNSRANKRTDKYGGSVENRCRFLLEVVDVITEVFSGPEMVCVKINPTDYLNDSIVEFEEMQEVYSYLITALVKRKVGIINLGRRGLDPNAGTEDLFGRSPRPEGYPLPPNWDPVLHFGQLVKSPGSSTLLMTNHDYTVEEADGLVKAGKLDLITFGRPFIYNPVSHLKSCFILSANVLTLLRILSLVSSTEYRSAVTTGGHWFTMVQERRSTSTTTIGQLQLFEITTMPCLMLGC